MYQVNLLPWRIRQRQAQWRTVWRYFWLILLAITLIGLGLYLYLAQKQAQNNARWQQQQTQLRQLTTQYQQQQQQETALALLASRYVAQQQRRATNARYLHLLEHFQRYMPVGAWLTQFDDRGAALVISGVSKDYRSVTQLASALASNHEIADVQLVNVQLVNRPSANPSSTNQPSVNQPSVNQQQPTDATLRFVFRGQWLTGEKHATALSPLSTAVPQLPTTITEPTTRAVDQHGRHAIAPDHAEPVLDDSTPVMADVSPNATGVNYQ